MDLATCHYNLAREYVGQASRCAADSADQKAFLAGAEMYFRLAARKDR